MQLLLRNERPALGLALHVQESMGSFRKLQVVNVAVLQKSTLRCTALSRTEAKETKLLAVDEVSLLAQRTSVLTSRYPRRAGESVALGAWPGELLEVREVLYHDALLLARDGAASGLLHEKPNPLPALVFTLVVVVLVRREVCVVEKVRVAEFAHEGAADGGRVGENAERVSFDVPA